jgi:uncharacterized protein
MARKRRVSTKKSSRPRKRSYRRRSYGKKKLPLVNIRALFGLLLATGLIFIFTRFPVSVRSVVPECEALFQTIEEQVQLRSGALAEISKSFEEKSFYGTGYKQAFYRFSLVRGVKADKFWYGIAQSIPKEFTLKAKEKKGIYEVLIYRNNLRVATVELIESETAPVMPKRKAPARAKPAPQPSVSRKRVTPEVVPVRSHPVAPSFSQPVAKKSTPQRQTALAPKMVVSRPVSVQGRIAIIIDDVGNTREHESLFFSLPREITPAILPQLTFSEYFAHKAHARGHDVMLHLPMEALKSYLDPGPGAVVSSMGGDEIIATVRANLSTVPHAVGVNNHMGSRCTQDMSVMRSILSEVKRRGLFFLDSYTSVESVVPVVMRELAMPYYKRNVFLDNESDPAYIKGQMRELIAYAKQEKTAIGIGHYRVNTLQVLKEMVPEIESEGIEIVKVRALM